MYSTVTNAKVPAGSPALPAKDQANRPAPSAAVAANNNARVAVGQARRIPPKPAAAVGVGANGTTPNTATTAVLVAASAIRCTIPVTVVADRVDETSGYAVQVAAERAKKPAVIAEALAKSRAVNVTVAVRSPVPPVRVGVACCTTTPSDRP